jgi:hypothetical protein
MSHSKKNLDPLKVKKLSSFQENLGLFQSKKKFIIKCVKKNSDPFRVKKIEYQRGQKKLCYFIKILIKRSAINDRM